MIQNSMKTIRDIPHLDGVKVLVRVDFNVPIVHDKVVEDFRIRMTFPTIDFLLEKGAIVILISHIESAEGAGSLEPIAKCLQGLGKSVVFVKDIKQAHSIIESAVSGDLILLDNLRKFPGEEANDKSFARELASLADIYVNEAFSVCHRKHVSIVGVPQFLPSYAGLQLEKEINTLKMTFNPPHPFVFLLNGAKFETKLPILQKFIDIADIIFVGGALSSDLLKHKGYEVGRSLVSKEVDIDFTPFINNPKILLPVDVVDEDNNVWPADKFPASGKIVDAGPGTVEMLREKMQGAKFILWNGTLGFYEAGYKQGTEDVAKIIAAETKNGAMTMIGGGDTIAAIKSLGITDEFSFVSTGGGAMLEYLSSGTLVGIEAIEKSEGN